MRCSIALVTRLLGRLYYQQAPQNNPAYDPSRAPSGANPPLLPAKPGVLPIEINAALSAVALVGTFMGQLVWGRLGDVLGRKYVYGATLVMVRGERDEGALRGVVEAPSGRPIPPIQRGGLRVRAAGVASGQGRFRPHPVS